MMKRLFGCHWWLENVVKRLNRRHRFESTKGTKTLRVWTKRTFPDKQGEFDDQHAEILRRIDLAHSLDFISVLRFVNAVEELDRSGNGRLVYVDWP